jgi:trimeric autotransporter adhesin
MRNILIIAFVMTLVGILTGGTVTAGVPGSISYQGKLTNALGQRVSDAAYQVQFKMYTVDTGGTEFWTSTPQNVTTSGGVFTTQLSPLTASDLAGRIQVWLEIWVGSPLVSLSPRTKFASVPYALVSGDSWSLLGNAGTTPGTNFIGTTDNQPLEFRVNNTCGFRLEATENTPNLIGGYSGNTVSPGGCGDTIAGGGNPVFPNNASSYYSTVSGGSGNTASGYASTVSGGLSNTASDGITAIVGGRYNVASGYGNTVSGGASNTASGIQYSAIGGGFTNTASGQYATVPGGANNTAAGDWSLAAGQRAQANHSGSFVWSDSTTISPNFFASTAANQYLIKASGGVGINTNNPQSALDVVGTARMTGVSMPTGAAAGKVLTSDASGIGTWQSLPAVPSAWLLTGNAGTTPGTNFIGTTDNQALEFKVNSVRGLRLEPTAGTPNVIGGYSGNTVTAGVYGATISGGGYISNLNSVTSNFGKVGGGAGNTAGTFATLGGGAGNTAGSYATIGGGAGNTAGNYATIGGGHGNNANGGSATVGGGFSNAASGLYATNGGGEANTASGICAIVSGGYANTASGDYATVAGGNINTAGGLFSFAAGRRGKANHDGVFVWADSTGGDLASTGTNQFMARASGGVYFYTNATATTGVYVPAGSGAWSSVSDRNLKANFASIDGKEILAKVAALPMSTWNYKSQDASIRHIGPVAQDFAAAFKVGEDDKHISTIDADGVALAAIQGLCEELKIRDAKIAEQQKEIDEIKALVTALVSKQQEKQECKN